MSTTDDAPDVTTDAADDDRAFLVIKPGRFFLGIWFAGDHTGDWMGAIYRDKGSDHYEMRYRFRYSTGPDPWDNDDRKSSYRCSIPAAERTPEQLVEMMNQAAVLCARQYGNEPATALILNSDDPERIVGALQQMPWAHTLRGPGGKQ